jgi:Skp family chaperone for outer membrane proteins
MKKALSLFPAVLLTISAFHAFIVPEKFNYVLAISAILFAAQQILSHFEQPDLAKELKKLQEKQAKEIEALRADTSKQMAELRDDFAKASMIISNKAAAAPSAPKSKQMMF